MFEKMFDGFEALLAKFKLELVAEWRKFYATYSFWFFVILGGLPDFYDLVVSSGMLDALGGTSVVPPFLTNSIKTIAFLGAATRFIKQKKVEAEIAKRSGSA